MRNEVFTIISRDSSFVFPPQNPRVGNSKTNSGFPRSHVLWGHLARVLASADIRPFLPIQPTRTPEPTVCGSFDSPAASFQLVAVCLRDKVFPAAASLGNTRKCYTVISCCCLASEEVFRHRPIRSRCRGQSPSSPSPNLPGKRKPPSMTALEDQILPGSGTLL